MTGGEIALLAPVAVIVLGFYESIKLQTLVSMGEEKSASIFSGCAWQR